MKRHITWSLSCLLMTLFHLLPTFGAEMVIESLDGAVTRDEIASFKTFMQGRQPSDNNVGNDWVYGESGKDTEALGMMFEVSADVAILDRMISFADAALACRNDPTNGRVIWTGRRELCWPNKALTAPDARYSGSESGDVVGHVAYCAKLILQTPSIWTNRATVAPPAGCGPSYKERALFYVREMERVVETFIIPNFVSLADSNHYRWPDSAQYGALGSRYEADRGKPIPWNQQTMLSNGFLRLAECHKILGDDNARVAKYNAIVGANLQWFLGDLHPYEREGHTVYDWGYSLGRKREDVPHAGYDIWGLCRAFDNGGFGVPAMTMTNFANTLRFVIYDPAGKVFHMRVDGTDGGKAPRSAIAASWILVTRYGSTEFYPMVANASLKSANTRPLEFATVMLMKQRRHK